MAAWQRGSVAACMAACVVECTTAERLTECAPPLGSQHGPLWFRGYARPRGDEEAACDELQATRYYLLWLYLLWRYLPWR